MNTKLEDTHDAARTPFHSWLWFAVSPADTCVSFANRERIRKRLAWKRDHERILWHSPALVNDEINSCVSWGKPIYRKANSLHNFSLFIRAGIVPRCNRENGTSSTCIIWIENGLKVGDDQAIIWDKRPTATWKTHNNGCQLGRCLSHFIILGSWRLDSRNNYKDETAICSPGTSWP